MKYSEIENAARALQKQIWAERNKLWPEHRPNTLEMFQPEVAARILGFEYCYEEELRNFGREHRGSEIAGAIDRQRGLIAISKRFSIPTQRFTGGHEIGHLLLHSEQIVMHRDRPIGGMVDQTTPRPPIEREADYFAACFLAPRKLVVESFQSRFGKPPLRLDDTTAFWLCPNDADSLLRHPTGALDYEIAVAGCCSFAGRPFRSLAQLFDVSVTTMAIRLRELRLLAE